jgi:hypothetical protein
MADVDPSPVQQVLAIAQRQREPDVHHHGKTDDLWACFEVLEWGRLVVRTG